MVLLPVFNFKYMYHLKLNLRNCQVTRGGGVGGVGRGLAGSRAFFGDFGTFISGKVLAQKISDIWILTIIRL